MTWVLLTTSSHVTYTLHLIVSLLLQVQDNAGIGAFVVAWSVTEVIRYSFYVCSLLDSVPPLLQWCR